MGRSELEVGSGSLDVNGVHTGDWSAAASTTGTTSAEVKRPSDNGLNSMAVNCSPEDRKEKLKPKRRSGGLPVLRLFRYADGIDRLLMFVGGILAICQGAAMPAFSVIFGGSMSASVGKVGGTFVEEMSSVLASMGVLACCSLVAGTVWQTCYVLAAERQGKRMRVDYLRKLLTRDIEWFDTNDAASLPTRMASEVQSIQDAIGSKTGQMIMSVSQFCVGIGVGFYKGWELTLVLCVMIPVFGVSGFFFARSLATLQSDSQAWFGKAGAAAEQAILSIRTVAAFGGEQREADRFEGNLVPARRGGIIAGLHLGLSFGMVMGSFALSYALAFWFGAHYMVATNRINESTGVAYTGSEIVLVFFAVLIGIMSLNDISPPFLCIMQGLASSTDMNKVLQAECTIEECAHPNEALPAEAAVLERIDFKQVEFSYPSRPDVPILRGLTLSITRGQKVALVGESGSGKSTVVQLLERFYDPHVGEVLVNSVPLSKLPLAAWRRLIGYVGQEPVLFATTVLENIKGSNPNITEEEAEQAARQAEAYDFLSKLPNKLHTFVGVGGGQMSGGQKQRIAIARALVKKPQLLLLDEATSALDNESEKQVQATIDHLQTSSAEGLTTISIAHRLSTIKNSDTIFVFKTGQVTEKGTHTELMAQMGEYYNLVKSQSSIETDNQVSAQQEVQGTPSAAAAALANSQTLPGQPTLHAAVAAEAGKADAGLPALPHKRSNHDEIEKMRLKDLAEAKYKPPWGRLLKMSRREWWVFPLAFVGALLSGGSMPVQGYLFSEATAGFYTTCDGLPPYTTTTPVDKCPDAMIKAMNSICLYFVLVAIGSLVGDFLKHSLFTFIQECLVLRLRSAAFGNLIRQDVGFFDNPRNAPGGLTSSLARQTLQVAQMTGISLGNTASAAFALVGGIILGLIGSWKLSLAILALVPAVMVAMGVVMKMTLGGGGTGAKYSVAGEIASEALLNIRTVRALVAEGTCVGSFDDVVSDICVKESRGAPLKGFAFGFGNAIMFTIYILGFGYGAKLADEGLPPNKMYQALMCILLGAIGASFAVTFSADASKGKLAAFDIFQIIDRPSKVDAVAPDGHHRDLGDGSIEFANVQFVFPHRPDTTVLRMMSFKVTAGQSVALVGPSGSGKSTVIQLLQRFYDPTGGALLVGGVNLLQFDVSWWRRQLGFVGQEPILFDMSLQDNVMYGKPDATFEEVERAAKMANMDYVLQGKASWADIVGTKGGKLSGGQKQRCAIARALIRDPKVLLLDEATSALDSVSERVVQQALDTAREGRTTFTIAHRLSTIRDADVILVVASGQIEEQGNHDELMAMGGLYCNLAKRGAQ